MGASTVSRAALFVTRSAQLVTSGEGGSFLPTFTLDSETFNGLTYYREIDGDEIALLPKLDKQKMFRGIPDTGTRRRRWSSATNAPGITARLARWEPVRPRFSK